jgi:cytosine/adenosine deaminase-related metal-dependent hydrolase
MVGRGFAWFAGGCLLLGCGSSAVDDAASGAASGTGGSGGIGGSGAAAVTSSGTAGGIGPSGPDAVIVSSGAADKILLRGMLLTPGQAFSGEVLVEGAQITCVAPSCADEAAAVSATVVDTNGIIMPGMIDAHNHVLFNVFDESDWSPSKAYGNHKQWTNEPRYSAMIDAKQYLNGESGSPINLNCELNKYGELKALVAGTTSMVGGANPGNKICYRTLTRTIDQSANGLCGTNPLQSCPDKVQVNTLFPSSSSANKVCSNFADDKTRAYLIHLGEGVDASASSEFETLGSVTTPNGCLYSDRTVVVHGTAFDAAQLDVMAQNSMGLVWSPRSNVFLYGGGTDLSKTTDVPTAREKGIEIALSPDWSLGGGKNLLEELRFADRVDDEMWGNGLDAETLVAMVTINPARLLAVDAQIGALEVGKRADITVIGGDTSLPYRSVIAATPRAVRLVMVDGAVLYGDDQLSALNQSRCDAIDICGRSKFLCVAVSAGAAKDKLDQTYGDIVTALETALTEYDALGLSQWSFTPLAPLVQCDGG